MIANWRNGKKFHATADNLNTSDGGLYQASKRLKESNSRSYANIAAGNANSADIRVSKEKPGRIVGKTIFSNLKVAPRDTSPLAVFCASNVSHEYSINDIRKHCNELGIRVRFIYDISAVNQVAKAFKLAIGSNDASIVQDGKSWPVGVYVRIWRHYNRSDNMTTAPSREENRTSSNIIESIQRNEGLSATKTRADIPAYVSDHQAERTLLAWVMMH